MKAFTLIVRRSFNTIPDDETVFLVAANDMQGAVEKLNKYIYKNPHLFGSKNKTIPCKELKKDFENYKKDYFWALN